MAGLVGATLLALRELVKGFAMESTESANATACPPRGIFDQQFWDVEIDQLLF